MWTNCVLGINVVWNSLVISNFGYLWYNIKKDGEQLGVVDKPEGEAMIELLGQRSILNSLSYQWKFMNDFKPLTDPNLSEFDTSKSLCFGNWIRSYTH